MALIKCKECGKEFSDMATACPNCGYSPALEQKKAIEKNLLPEGERKSKITAGFLCLFLWVFGAHEFYLGNVGGGIAWIIMSFIVSFTCGVFPILFLLILIPIIGAVKLWTMPIEKFDIKYNQISSPKSKLGCLFGIVIVLIPLILFFVSTAFSAYQKAVQESRMREMSNIIDATKNQVSDVLDNI